MPRICRLILLLGAIAASVGEQGYGQAPAYAIEEGNRTLYDIPPRDLVDAPTAGTLPRGCFHIIMRVYNNGGILSTTSIGLSNRFSIGMSYGAEGIISDGKANPNPRIEFNVKLRLINEEYFMPALAVGYNSQGYGAYHEDQKRYAFKSKGFYGVISRSFYMYNWALGGHIGVNYSLENDYDKDEEPSFFFGMDTRLSYDIGFAIEYDMALNDDREKADYARGRGYLNLGIRWLYSENLSLEIILKDLLINRREAESFGRELRLTYIEFF